MSDTLTVETTMDTDAPEDAEAFIALGGPFILQYNCASELLKLGCRQESITFEEPQVKDDKWTIIGKGERP